MLTKTPKKRISATIDSDIFCELKRITKSESKNQSEIIEKALEFFLKKQLFKDSKDLSQIKFEDLPTEEEWLMINS